MSRMERIYQIDQLPATRKAVSGRELRETLRIAEPTLKRDIVYMRDRLNARIVVFRRGNSCAADHAALVDASRRGRTAWSAHTTLAGKIADHAGEC